MLATRLATGAAIVLAAGGCAATRRPIIHAHQRAAAPQSAPPRSRPVRRRHTPRPPLQAVVTAQTEDRLLVVDLPSGRVVRRVRIPGEPEYAAAGCGVVVAVSAASGTVTVLARRSLRTLLVVHGFASPHIPMISPDCDYAYVTDDASGRLSTIGLYDHRLLSRTPVGIGAHHLAANVHEVQIWVSLGQAASRIAILSTIAATPPPPASTAQDPARPHVVAWLRPGFLVHDLLFTPDGRRVWVTSADTDYVAVLAARSHRLLFRVPGGPPPQHVVFAGASAYISSGYGSTIERVSLASGRILARAHAPYGSFDLDAGGGYVVTSSLFEGTIAVYDRRLRLLRIRRLAPSAEDVSIVPAP